MHRLVTPDELTMLKHYASLSRLGIVEIGVLDGGTTRELISSSSVMVYGIDPMIPDSNDPNLVGNINYIREIPKERFSFYQDFSYNVRPNFNHSYDFVFIDGSHRCEDVKRDCLDWSVGMNAESIIAFHDTTVLKLRDGRDGPQKFIDEEMMHNKDFDLIGSIDSLKVFRKLK